MSETKPVGDTNWAGQPISHPIRLWGWGLVLVGLVVGCYATMGYDPSVESTGMYGVPDRIVNTARLQTQTLTFATGAIFFLSGVICLATNTIYNLLREVAHRQLGYSDDGSQAASVAAPQEASMAAGLEDS